MAPTWEERLQGVDCPLCAPRTTIGAFNIEIAKLTIATLYLGRNQVFRGYCVLIFDPRHVTGLQHLSQEENRALIRAGAIRFGLIHLGCPKFSASS